MNDFKLGRTLTAIVGLVVAFLIALFANGVAGLFSGARLDLTENKVHTLSEGTKNILDRLETPVSLRYYSTDGLMSPGEKARARRVKEKLDEFVRAAPVKEIEISDPETGEFVTKKMRMLQIEKLNPEPNTDAEDSAKVDGIRPAFSGETNNQIFMGIAIKCIDSEETLPWIDNRGEETLEYDLIRAISSVHGGKEKTVRVMTSLPISGGMGANFQAPPQPQWIFYQQIGQEYTVETIAPTASEIPADTACLIVLHPFDITDAGQFAIDQFLLGGGNVVVMVDPNFFYARSLGQGQPQMPGMPPQGGPSPTSDLSKLFKTWGVTYDSTQCIADLSFGSEILRPGNFSPTFLTLTGQAVTSEDSVVDMLNNLNMLTPGAFDITGQPGITIENLIETSEANKFVSTFDADPTQEGGTQRIRQGFVPSGIRRPLVARLTGNFKTAFPDGDPSAEPAAEEETEDAEDAEDAEEKTEETDDSLKESTNPGQVLLIADVDFIFDPICVDRQTIPGLGVEMVQPRNQNLTLVQNAIEQLSGDPDLINVRSRNTGRRPFSRINDWMAAAEQKFADQRDEFQQKQEDAARRLGVLISQSAQGGDQENLSLQAQEEIRKLEVEEAEYSQIVRQLEKDVTKEFRSKLGFIKTINTIAMPFVILIAGIAVAIFRKTRTAAR